MEIKNKIYEIRGIKVMIDRELADAIGYETKVLNQLVKRNITKFESHNYFQLNQEEFNVLKSQIVTSNIINHGGVRYLPYAFSKEGIKTLSTILRKENSKDIIDKILEEFDDTNKLILSNKNALIPVNTGNSIQNMIYEIRGQLVMLDSDLAKIYECKNGTKDINKAVNRNKDRFPNDFYFQLTNTEYLEILRFQNGTLRLEWGKFSKYNPYVFTEQGVAMLTSVLKTEIASITSVGIMRSFVMMRKYISNKLYVKNYITNQVLKNTEDIRILKESFSKLSEQTKNNHLFYEGQIYDAYSLLIKILKDAKEEIIIIDNYAGRELFDILRDVKCNIKVITKNTTEELINKYNKQYNNVKLIKNDTFHDRFIIIDKKILYHSGSSFKDLGKKCFAINKMESDILINILNKIEMING